MVTTRSTLRGIDIEQETAKRSISAKKEDPETKPFKEAA